MRGGGTYPVVAHEEVAIRAGILTPGVFDPPSDGRAAALNLVSSGQD